MAAIGIRTSAKLSSAVPEAKSEDQKQLLVNPQTRRADISMFTVAP